SPKRELMSTECQRRSLVITHCSIRADDTFTSSVLTGSFWACPEAIFIQQNTISGFCHFNWYIICFPIKYTKLATGPILAIGTTPTANRWFNNQKGFISVLMLSA